jgi:diguanylate cyclase (GGDEF)-like protein
MAGKVLVVEDDLTIRQLIRAVLTGHGHAVSEVGDGLAALEAAQRDRPDVVLLDIGLPGQDGFAVLAELKKDTDLHAIPVLMVTAWDDIERVSRALNGGAHDYVRKPFAATELAARVEAALRVKTTTDALADSRAQLTELALHDPLTGLSNRRALENALDRALQPMATASVILADIDRFSTINNEHGHDAGDAALRGIARRLRTRARASDIVGRWGGEEFLVLVSDTDLGGAGALAEDLRVGLAERPVAGLGVTASFGVAAYDGRESAAELVARADAALYEAKREGRNAVRLAQSSGWSSSLTIAATGIGTQSGRLLSS